MINKAFQKGKEAIKTLVSLLLVVGIAAGPVLADETATLSIKSIPNVNVRMYGFVENDLINDSTQGAFAEEMDNNAIPKANVYAGNHHQTIMSVRNSRLGFDITMPKTDYGLETEGIFEFDMLGNSAGTAQRDVYNNPSVRIRHAYVNITDGQWNGKIGQTWSLLGWQPYYFPSEAIVQPAVGQLYRRFAQARVTNTQKFMDGDWTLESAIDAARPAEVNSGLPIEQAGLRLASTKYKAASGIGSGTPLVGASIGVSGELVPYRTAAYGSANGSTLALDLLVPIIPSTDGKDASNNLSLTAEYSNGRGDGGLELAGLTAGIGSVTDGSAALGTGVGAIDSGEAGLVGGNLDLPHFQTYRTNLTYVLPGAKWSTSAGYADVMALNLADYGSSSSLIPHMQYYYLNAMFMPLTWLRFALEWAQTKDTYNDPVNRFAYNNRIHFTTYITF